MKIYKCDLCGDNFEPDEGMTKGYWTGKRKAKWQNPDGTIYEIKINKTMQITREIPATTQLAAHEVNMDMDMCRPCVAKFERP